MRNENKVATIMDGAWFKLGNREIYLEKEELAEIVMDSIFAAIDVAKENGDYTRNHIHHGGYEILCDTEARANGVADFLEALGFSYVRTGYYDPDEDERNGEIDEYTGWWYVDWD